MASPFFSGRIPQDLYDRIDQHIKETCEGKTQILINALSAYLGVEISKPAHSNIDLFVTELEQIKDRLTILEESARSPRTAKNQITQMSLLDTHADKTNNSTINTVITEAVVDDNIAVNVINGEQILTTRSVCELTGIDRKKLSYVRTKNTFPIQKGEHSIAGYAGKQEKSPYADLWIVITTDNG